MNAARRVGYQDTIANNADGAKDDAEYAAALGAVGQPGYQHVGRRADKVARDGEELDFGRGPPADAVDDGRQEGRVSVQHAVAPELAGTERPDLPVPESPHHVLPAELAAALRVAVLPLVPRLHQCLFLRGQKVRRRRVVGQGHQRDDAQHKGGDAFDDHDPSPAGQALDAVEMAQPEAQEAADGAGQGGRHEEVPDPQGQLVLGVEESQVDVHAGKETGLDGAEEEAAGHEGAVALDEAGAGGDDAPRGDDEGEPSAGGELLEDEVGGDLEEDVGDEEDGDGDLVLVALEVDVCLEVVEASITNVDACSILLSVQFESVNHFPKT